jgi:lipopolysaccharide heptosyltransferase II
MALPAVDWLRARQPGRPLAVLAPPGMRGFWEHVPAIGTFIATDPNLWITACRVRELNASETVLFPNSLRSALEVWLARIPLRHGFKGHNRQAFLTHIHCKPLPKTALRHQALDFLSLVRQSAAQEIHQDDFEKPGLPELRAPAVPLSRELSPSSIAVAAGAAYGPAKRWPVERYAAVINTLGRPALLLGAAGDEETSERLAKLLEVPFQNLTGRTSLTELMALLLETSLLLSNDSGTMHLAAALRVPTLALFGSTEPLLTGPLHPCVQVLREHVPCSPCFLRECPIDFRCMRTLSTGQVLQHAEAILHSASK